MRNVMVGAAAVLSAAIGCGGHRALRLPPAPEVAPAAVSRETATPVAPPPATPNATAEAPAPEAAAPEASPDFVRDVKPLLARTCTPCHVPGGKMYDRLPFDDPKTVASAQAGILRRLKGDDHDLVARWIAIQAEPR